MKEAIEESPSLSGVPKKLYCGIHHGITEPKAIKILKSITQTEVYIVSPTYNISNNALVTRPIYHPKYCVLFCKGAADRWLIGSANLTGAAVGPSGNIEIGTLASVADKEKVAARKALSKWRNFYTAMIIKANDSEILQYEQVRLTFLQKNPIVLDQTDSTDDLSVAKSLFIEVGAASGMDRHQVEFNRKLATFFGPLPNSRRNLALRTGNRVWDGRPLTPKKTTFNVEIFRLGMPTIRNYGEKISERAIKFMRTSDANQFDIEVDDVDGPKYSAWVKECNANGHLGSTSGGRTFGYVL